MHLIQILLVITCPIAGQKLAEDRDLPAQQLTFPPMAEPIPLGSVISDIARQTGLEVDISAIDKGKFVRLSMAKTGFWNIVESLAEQTDSRVVIGRRGKHVSLTPHGDSPRLPASIDGPFRIVAREVEARIDLSSGKTLYDLTLEIAWEANLPVYRIDAQPKITHGFDDAKMPITVQPIDARNPVSGTHALLRVRLNGLDRRSQRIEVLQGELKVTAAAEMLRFTFDSATAPVLKKQKDVEVRLKPVIKQGANWVVDVQLRYPANSAEFESFETYWLGRNRCTLISPDGKTRLTSDDAEINGNSLTYRFKPSNDLPPANLDGWKVEYETPGVIREAPVRFELKGIALP